MVIIDWERLARSECHPLRVSVLELLTIDNGRAMSPNEMSFELQVPVTRLSYHVTELAAAGLLDPAGTEQRRGALEHYYRLAEGGQ
jgi:predicted transcriptional regulator